MEAIVLVPIGLLFLLPTILWWEQLRQTRVVTFMERVLGEQLTRLLIGGIGAALILLGLLIAQGVIELPASEGGSRIWRHTPRIRR